MIWINFRHYFLLNFSNQSHMIDHIYILDDSYEKSLFEQSNESEYEISLCHKAYGDQIVCDKIIIIYRNFQLSG